MPGRRRQLRAMWTGKSGNEQSLLQSSVPSSRRHAQSLRNAPYHALLSFGMSPLATSVLMLCVLTHFLDRFTGFVLSCVIIGFIGARNSGRTGMAKMLAMV